MKRRFSAQIWSIRSALAVLVTLPCVAPLPAAARSADRIAEVVVDASSGSVLYANQPDALRRPASLTKMMTLYLAFDALEDGRLRLRDPIVMSRAAARQPPSSLGVGVGTSLSVRTALEAIATHSANDVAVALAEKLAGREDRFVASMNAKARQLGMGHTHFANATGLTNPGNVTTARDIAALSVALVRRHPHEYAVFATRALQWRGRRLVNHNHLLGKVAGVDGIKTGYTVDAGYNLAASAIRRGKRIIAVVLGARTIAARDLRTANLVELGFSSQGLARNDVATSGAAASARRFHLKMPRG
jgi:D-alanyl-D-alanine carboxypeptidase